MNHNQPNVLFLNPNWENNSLIRSICNIGFNVVGFGESLDPKNALLPGYRHIKGDIHDYKSLYDICMLYSIVSVISDNCDYSLLISETLSSILDLPSLGQRSAEISNNKYLQRELARRSGISQPRYAACKSVSDIVRFFSKYQLDYLIKPIDSRGSMGISYLTSASTSNDISKGICGCLSVSPSGNFLVEEYILGELYTIDGFIVNDELFLVGLASRIRSGLGSTVTRQILYKSSFTSSLFKSSFDFLMSVKKAFRYSSGHIHCEALLDASGVFYLVECTNRGAGVFTSSTINPYVCGIDLNLEYISLKADLNIPSKFDYSSRIIANKNDASLLFPSLGDEGRILQRFDKDAILEIELVLEVQLFVNVGRPLPSSLDGPSRHFAVALKTSDANKIKSTIEYIQANCVTLS